MAFVGVRVLLAALGWALGWFVIAIPAYADLWAWVHYHLIVSDEHRPFVRLQLSTTVPPSRGGPADTITYYYVPTGRYAGEVARVWAPPCTGQALTLAVWPLLITRWRPWPVARAFLGAWALTAALNLWRLYVIELMTWQNVPWDLAHGVPGIAAGFLAYGVGGFCMWRSARALAPTNTEDDRTDHCDPQRPARCAVRG